MDDERLAEIDRQIEALGQPETPLEAVLANLSPLDLAEADAILAELAEGHPFDDIELAPLPELPRATTSVSEPPTGVSEAPPEVDEPGATEELPALTLDDEEFDLPPPSAVPPANEDLGSGLEDLGTSEIPEPLSPSLAAWIDPPDSEIPSDAPQSASEAMPPNPKMPDLRYDDGDFEEDERTGLFSQEDIDAIRASQPPPPRSSSPRSAPPPASRSMVASVPPPVPDRPPPAASAPPPPIPVSMAPPASDEDLEILDDDDFELMIEEDVLDEGVLDDEEKSEGASALDELIETGFDDPTTDDDVDEPVIREPEVAEDVPAELSEPEEPQEPQEPQEPDLAEPDESDEDDDEGEKKGFFKKLFG